MAKVDRKNLKLVIAYDGTAYKGWQKNAIGQSIEGTLQQVLEQILQHPVSLQAASRTDAGVHARGQVVNFFTTSDNIVLKRLRISLNQLLPSDIVVLEIEHVPEQFHPTTDVLSKEYQYMICYGKVQMPEDRLYSWHLPYSLDIASMRAAAQFFCGEFDFKAFCNFKKNEMYKDYIRSLTTVEIDEFSTNRLQIRITGKNFLYKMVRNIVGTLVYVGREKIAISEVPKILASKDRTQAGMTAPALGLTLHKINYKDKEDEKE